MLSSYQMGSISSNRTKKTILSNFWTRPKKMPLKQKRSPLKTLTPAFLTNQAANTHPEESAEEVPTMSNHPCIQIISTKNNL